MSFLKNVTVSSSVRGLIATKCDTEWFAATKSSRLLPVSEECARFCCAQWHTDHHRQYRHPMITFMEKHQVHFGISPDDRLTSRPRQFLRSATFGARSLAQHMWKRLAVGRHVAFRRGFINSRVACAPLRRWVLGSEHAVFRRHYALGRMASVSDDEHMGVLVNPGTADSAVTPRTPEEAATDLRVNLTDREKQIFATMMSVVRDDGLDTTLRVAGGWVRDKVCWPRNAGLPGITSHGMCAISLRRLCCSCCARRAMILTSPSTT